MHQSRGVEATSSFERVREGVAEVQQRSLPGLVLIYGYDSRLCAHAGRDGFDTLRAAGEYSIRIGFKPSEERSIADEADLDDLGVPGRELPPREGIERR